jgi:hypothetical protein
MAWKEHEASLLAKLKSKDTNGNSASDAKKDSSIPVGLETLTIEFQHNNIIVRAIQPKLLLVLVGGVPPSRKSLFKITPEAYGDPRYPSTENPEEESPPSGQANESDASAEGSSSPGEGGSPTKKKAASIISTMSQRDKDLKIGALHIQRKKIDALTDFIRADFDSKGFVMPDDSGFP